MQKQIPTINFLSKESSHLNSILLKTVKSLIVTLIVTLILTMIQNVCTYLRDKSVSVNVHHFDSPAVQEYILWYQAWWCHVVKRAKKSDKMPATHLYTVSFLLQPKIQISRSRTNINLLKSWLNRINTHVKQTSQNQYWNLIHRQKVTRSIYTVISQLYMN